MDTQDVHNIQAESGVIATLLLSPHLIFASENLTHHFYNPENAYIYYAINELVERGVETIDAYNIYNILTAKESTRAFCEDRITIQSLNDLIATAPIIARSSAEDYRILAGQVIDTAFRREAIKVLKQCETMCLDDDETESIQTRVYKSVESLVTKYQNTDELKPLGQTIDGIWEKIELGRDSGSFIDFMFPSINQYVKLSRTDAIVVAAREKRGKSIFLMNCAVDLLKKGLGVLVIDTELDTPKYVMRLLSHLTQIEFSRIQDGTYNEEEHKKILKAIEWLKTRNFCHKYIPAINDDQLIAAAKIYMHTYGLDCLILDYLKGNTSMYTDAYANSAVLGKTTDTLKNIIAGDMNLFVLTAVQATNTGAIADSQKIIRNSSALLYLDRKDQSMIDGDGGEEYGNMYINVRANRNGAIMGDEEYISLTLDGNKCTFHESKQAQEHIPY